MGKVEEDELVSDYLVRHNIKHKIKMAKETVEKMTENWMNLTDYHILMRSKGGEYKKLSTKHIYNQIEKFNKGEATAKEIGFVPHRLSKSEVLLIEPLN